MMIVEDEIKISPFNDALIIFCNRTRDKLKYYVGIKQGFTFGTNDMKKDKIKWPRKSNSSTVELSEQQWDWLLSCLDISK